MLTRSLATVALTALFALPSFSQSEFDNVRWHVFAEPSTNQTIVVEETKAADGSKTITRLWYAPKGKDYLEGATVKSSGSLSETGKFSFSVNATRKTFENVVVNEIITNDDLGLQFLAYELVYKSAAGSETKFGYFGKTNMLHSYASDGTMERVTPGMLTANEVLLSNIHQQRFFTQDNSSSVQFRVEKNEPTAIILDGKEIPVSYNSFMGMFLLDYKGQSCTGGFFYTESKLTFSIYANGDRLGQFFGNLGELMID